MEGTMRGAARWDRAMTLVELMVVLGLMALLMTLVAVHSNTASYRLKSTVFSLRSLMQRARLEAVRTNKNTYVDFDADDDGRLNSVVLWLSMGSKDAGTSFRPGEDQVLGSLTIFEPSASPGNRPTLGAVPPSAGGPTVGAPREGGSIPDDGVSFSGNRINFNPDGTSSAGSVYLHVPKHPEAGTYAIVVNNSGRVYLRYYPSRGMAWEDR
ncbi:pilus assembly FimT family protein [Desulfosoma sp.]|uniref:pilus assembly FimT family protein n=1 Tax=Desulfosoma sp. TaxID=2603217 RepID=UPI0040492A39